MRQVTGILFLVFGATAWAAPAEKSHWAWQPLKRPPIPESSKHTNPIDAFILQRLGKVGLGLVPEADRSTLIRRLTFNLTGLPPTPQEILAFEQESIRNPKLAFENLVDRLLASPAFGEHWAQHWLDLARFAETDGFEHDKVRPNAWRYRDWVIKALNDDLPYNQFVQLQIAGDQLQPKNPQAAIATGFLLAGQDMPDINLLAERRHMVLNEMTATVGSAFLGLTLGCAQCHDHKYDPISQKEFYQMRAFFESDLQLKDVKLGGLTARMMQTGKPLAARLMIRGDFRRPGERVRAGFPSLANVAGEQPKLGQRRELAEWLTRPDNALALRVVANRLWLRHFGRPLASPEDFGTQGQSPTHPALLDWLATELPRRKWSLKAMHKFIVTSATWRQASRDDGRDGKWQARLKMDPENKLWSRQARRRLTGEMLRDSMLAASSSLSNRKGGPGVRPPLPREITSTLLRNQWPVSKDEADHRCRSVYLFVRRNLRWPLFDLFDKPALAETCARRKVSITAPQSLALLNSAFVRDAAGRLAQRASREAGSPRQKVAACFQMALGRLPSTTEQTAALELAGGPANPVDGLGDLCLALFNLNEFLFVD
jgi:hypothetical protein